MKHSKTPSFFSSHSSDWRCMESKHINDVELYGNTFFHIGYEDFNIPNYWKIHNLFDSAFQIKLHPYMRNTENYPMRDGCASTIYMYRDTTETGKYNYGRIVIDYYCHGFGDFKKLMNTFKRKHLN